MNLELWAEKVLIGDMYKAIGNGQWIRCEMQGMWHEVWGVSMGFLNLNLKLNLIKKEG